MSIVVETAFRFSFLGAAIGRGGTTHLEVEGVASEVARDVVLDLAHALQTHVHAHPGVVVLAL